MFFLSTVDYNTGEMLYKGPKFLKTYFIESGDDRISKIVPFRPTIEPVLKSFVDMTSYPEKMLLKAMALMYGSLGTNKIVYDIAEEYYDILRNRDNRSPLELYYFFFYPTES